MKNNSIWECQSCGSQSPRWAGQCPECGKWNSLVETIVSPKLQITRPPLPNSSFGGQAKPQKLSEILKNTAVSQRISTQIGELDRVLGGGMVGGGVILLAGEPGMGKSTLLSQAALAVASSKFRAKSEKLKEAPAALYVCGEESPSQAALRLQRLAKLPARKASRGQADGPTADGRLPIILLPETNADSIISHLLTMKQFNNLAVVIIDSIQTLRTDDLSGMAGSVGQIRECAGRLSRIAKQLNLPLFLVGHITKAGEVAGPKVLEHMVDTVLVMKGERSGELRLIRAVKNRFGPVDEIGLFRMGEKGLAEVPNPAELLIGKNASAPGSVLGCVMEGQRPLVLEVQALTAPSKLPAPRRVGHGVRISKLQLLSAVIEKHIDRKIGGCDVYLNVAGGLAPQDPGLDLAIVAAVVSSLKQAAQSSITNHPPPSSTAHHLSPSLIFCGEVGLLGDVRQVPGWERREKEIARLKIGRLVGAGQIENIRRLPGLLRSGVEDKKK